MAEIKVKVWDDDYEIHCEMLNPNDPLPSNIIGEVNHGDTESGHFIGSYTISKIIRGGEEVQKEVYDDHELLHALLDKLMEKVVM